MTEWFLSLGCLNKSKKIKELKEKNKEKNLNALLPALIV